MASRARPVECTVASVPVRIPDTDGWIRGACTCGWVTPQAWTVLAGAEAAVRRDHIDRNKLLETLEIPVEPAAA